jgi:hypothetical protein
MRLKRLSVELDEYGENAGKYHGQVRFIDQSGAVEILLDNSLSAAVLKLCADSLITQAKKTADMMSARILEAPAQKELEDQS